MRTGVRTPAKSATLISCHSFLSQCTLTSLIGFRPPDVQQKMDIWRPIFFVSHPSAGSVSPFVQTLEPISPSYFMMNVQPEEYELALRAREGDADALTELIERMRPRLFALAYRDLGHHEDAQDALAAALLNICRH